VKALSRLAPLAAALALGCTLPPPPQRHALPRLSAFRSPALARLGRLRVLVLPFRHTESGVTRSITEAFTLELEKTQALEVVSPYGAAAKTLEGLSVWEDGGVDVRALSILRRRLDVDALAIGRVTQYRPYDPPVLGLRVQVISARTGGVLWGAEGCFDAREAGVRDQMQRFHARRLDASPRSYGWQLLLSSPRHYAQFVAHELVATFEAGHPAAVAARLK